MVLSFFRAHISTLTQALDQALFINLNLIQILCTIPDPTCTVHAVKKPHDGYVLVHDTYVWHTEPNSNLLSITYGHSALVITNPQIN